jgi:hypothetical protein
MSISGNRLTLNATTTANLQASSTAFKLSDEDYAFKGYDHFFKTPSEVRNKVYEQLWVNKNKPMGDHRYGEFAFFNMHGRRSTYLEKAEAIDKFIISSVIVTADSYDQRLQVNGWGADERRFSDYRVNHQHMENRNRENHDRAINQIIRSPNYTPADLNFDDFPHNGCVPNSKAFGIIVIGLVGIGTIAIQLGDLFQKLNK